VELRGFEPLAFLAIITPELQQMLSRVVARRFRELRICAGVLRDVTLLASPRCGYRVVRQLVRI
jgi:hypothetical protein